MATTTRKNTTTTGAAAAKTMTAPEAKSSRAKFRVTFTRIQNTPARASKTIVAESYNKNGAWVSFSDGDTMIYEAASYEVASIERISVDA